MKTKNLTNQGFIDHVFDYENNKEWVFRGERPAIIDFYADWCGPCQTMSPIYEELAEEYEGKVDFYKVNVDDEQTLSMEFGIRSIPTLFFIALNGQPMMQPGALPKHSFVDIIEKRLISQEDAAEG